MANALYRRPMGVVVQWKFVYQAYGSDVVAIVLYSRPKRVMKWQLICIGGVWE